MFEMVGDVSSQNHFRDNLPHVPVLGLAQKLENVILGVEENFKSHRTVVTF